MWGSVHKVSPWNLLLPSIVLGHVLHATMTGTRESKLSKTLHAGEEDKFPLNSMKTRTAS